MRTFILALLFSASLFAQGLPFPGIKVGAAGIVGGAPPIQASTSGGTGGALTNAQSFTQPITNGGLMVLMIFNATNSTATISSVVFTGGSGCGTFVATPGGVKAGATTEMWAYYAYETNSTCTGATVTFSGSVNSVVAFAEYSGMATSSVLDCESAATGTGTAINSGACTTTNANDTQVAGLFVTTSGGGTLTAGSGFTLRVNNSSTSHRGLEDKNLTATGTVASTATYSSSQTWISIMLALKRAV